VDESIQTTRLPHADFERAWDAIKLDAGMRERLVAQALLTFRLRTQFPFDVVPVHGLLLLVGPPGTGKTTLARGLANQVARALTPVHTTFLEVDPHALASSALGKSQKEVTKLFHQRIPEAAAHGPCVVLLDEIETIAADRQRLSLEANPIDVHRATDAALAGIDRLSRTVPRALVLGTTNFPEAVDRALFSRADLVQEIGLPSAEAREAIIREVLELLSSQWPDVQKLAKAVKSFVNASDGFDGRQLRKGLLFAAAVDIDTARDPNRLKADYVLSALGALAAGAKRGSET
jgi:pachytene checkpoint protein 2